MDVKAVMAKLEEWYGPGNGFKVYTTVMPGILRDFEGMLGSHPGSRVTEEYRLEDGKGTLILTGRQLKNGNRQLEISCRDGI